MNYWPHYSAISPACRSGYLDWLSAGRDDPSAYIGYVFLYLYGLERRALADLQSEGLASDELHVILAEVTRLLGIYESNRSFRGYATGLSEVLRYHLAGDAHVSPVDYQRRSEIPLAIRLGVGQAAVEGKKLDPELAFAWATGDPEIKLLTPALRCKKEFRQLFLLRYSAKYPSGIDLKVCKRNVCVEYKPASASFTTPYKVQTEYPDVTALVGPRRKLAEIVESTTSDLAAYSRKVGKNPSPLEALAAAGTLPTELFADFAPPELQLLFQGIHKELAGGNAKVLPAVNVLDPWLPKDGSKQSKRDAVAAAQLLGHSGIGIEPDVRFGGPKLSRNDTLVVFRLESGDPEAPSQAYSAAALLLHFAAMVAAADGEVSIEEERKLQEHVSGTLHLRDGEQRRLGAHIAWLLESPPGIAGVKKRVESLSTQQRQAISRFLVLVAAADGTIEPSEVKTMTKLFTVLGLDPGEVHVELHLLQSGSSVSDDPVSVRAAKPAAPGKAIPVEPGSASTDSSGQEVDMGLVRAKLEEAASVSALLSSIFNEDDDGETTVDEPPQDEGELDRAQLALLADLSARESWSRTEYEELASTHGLMPDGALDELNELAWETCDQPLAEDGDPLEINMDVCKELLAL